MKNTEKIRLYSETMNLLRLLSAHRKQPEYRDKYFTVYKAMIGIIHELVCKEYNRVLKEESDGNNKN